MQTVGIFAGRGDVILGMSFACMFGVWLGWELHRFYVWVKSKTKR